MYKGNTKYMPDVLVNYGVAGAKLKKFYKNYPSALNIPTINKHIGMSKLKMINIVSKQDINVPESKLILSPKDKPIDFIEKRIKSIGGIGICKARGKRKVKGKYYQKYIQDRAYEIRVHAFEWMKDLHVQKRYGKEDEIAWNFRNGGYFQTVHNPKSYKIHSEAIDVSRKILKLFKMGFGAVDFLVDSSLNLYFIEINSAPGFQELSEDIYVEAFTALKDINTAALNKLHCLC